MKSCIHFLSKGVRVLEVVRYGLPRSMATTYQVALLLEWESITYCQSLYKWRSVWS